jgi:hypothetical protein
MNPVLSTYLENAVLDLCLAVPAAVFRTLLQWRVEPGMSLLVRLSDKLRVLACSLSCGVMFGMLARAFPKTQEWALVIVVAAAFMAQDAGIALVKRGRRWLRDFLSEEKSQHKPDRHDPHEP